MKDQLNKFKQQATRSGFAKDVHVYPEADQKDDDRMHLTVVLGAMPVLERDAAPGEKLPEIPGPIEHAKTLLNEAGLKHGEIRWFNAAKDSAVVVFDVEAGGRKSEDGDRKSESGAPKAAETPEGKE